MSDSDPDTAHRPAPWLQRRAVRAIDWYQRAFAGRPSPCRFQPTCSSYAREAFEVHGSRRGLWLTVRRLLRCRPFGPSGFDPVPDPDVAELDVAEPDVAELDVTVEEKG